jgi:hypothetical protein
MHRLDELKLERANSPLPQRRKAIHAGTQAKLSKPLNCMQNDKAKKKPAGHHFSRTIQQKAGPMAIGKPKVPGSGWWRESVSSRINRTEAEKYFPPADRAFT